MRSTWNSRTKVTVAGDAFKTARIMIKSSDEAVRDKENQKRDLHGYGSQGWLAKKVQEEIKTNVSPRTISSLEGGKASLRVIDAVSKILGIQGRQYILGYGEQATKVSITHFVDFRPTINGRIDGNEEAYAQMPFLVTLDPINIKIEDEFIEKTTLKGMKLRLSVGETYASEGKDMIIDFVWLNNVNLTETAKTWLGDPEEVNEVTIKQGELYKQSVMFRQDSIPPVSWQTFCKYISEMGAKKDMEYPRILLTLTLNFEYFEKQISVLVSLPEIKSLVENFYPEGCPYWIQPKALMP